MPQWYTPVIATPSIRVLDNNTVLTTERCTIATKPTGIHVTWEVPIDAFNADGGTALLNVLGNAIEELVNNRHVTGGQPAQDYDDNGLLQDYLDAIVTYNRTTLPPLTATARIPVDLFFTAGDIAEFQNYLPPGTTFVSPDDICDATYAKLAQQAGA